MNIVKMQDTLKDLSDQQLLQTMQAGSTPQYLVLAEMQRRKKAREEGAQRSQQPQGSVADDIISGIAAVPTPPMEMAEGGLVSFAKGGKTGRMKGEEEACYTDSRTGEKYCPPSTPQVEMPRTGQRKSFEAGGEVEGYRQTAREMAERYGVDPDVFERLIQQESSFNPQAESPVGARGLGQIMPATARNPGYGVAPLENIDDPTENLRFAADYYSAMLDRFDGDEELALAAYNAGPEAVNEAGGVPNFPETQNYVAAVSGRAPSAQAYPAVDTREGAVEPLPETEEAPARARGSAAEQGYTFGDIVEGIGGLFSRPAQGGTRREQREAQTLKSAEEAAAGDMPPADPRTTGGRGAAGQDIAQERVRSQDQTAADEAARREEEAAGTDTPLPDPEPTGGGGGDDDEPTTVEEDGLMQLVRELREERAGIQEGSRERALNEALIRGGLTMAASDRPDFLAAAAEGGIGGLAGYQGAMERAAERQGSISADVSDLLIAREANDLRRQAAAARAAGAMSDMQFSRIDVLQSELENINNQLLEGVLTKEQTQQFESRRAQLAEALEAEYKNAGIELTSAVGGESDNPDRDASQFTVNQ